METELGSSNENSSLSLNSTQAWDWNFYNWCRDYPTMIVFWSTISVTCSLVGFPASLWVLHELLQRQRQRSTNVIFMLSLAIVDLSFTALIPFSVCNFMIWHSMELENSLAFIYSLSINARPLFMACICWDCYVAVVYPIVYKTSMKLIVVKKAITVTIGFITVVGGSIVYNIKLLSAPFIFAIPLILALPVISFCDIFILRALRKPDPTGKNNVHPQKKQALHTISNSFIMTFIVYLPPTIIFSFGKLMKLRDIDYFCCLNTYGVCFSTVGCVIMPVQYLICIGKLDAFKTWWNRQST